MIFAGGFHFMGPEGVDSSGLSMYKGSIRQQQKIILLNTKGQFMKESDREINTRHKLSFIGIIR